MGTLTPKTANKAPGKQKVAPIVKAPAVPPAPPGLFPTPYVIAMDPAPAAMTTAFDTIKNKSAFKYLYFALADMTGAKPVYFGHKDNRQVYVGSAVKVAVLYVAIWLRYTLRENAKHITATDSSDLFNKLKALFNGVARPFGDRFKNHTWPPKLDDIFVISGDPSQGWNIDFTSKRDYSPVNRVASLAALGPSIYSDLGETNKLGFRDRLELMVGWSGNRGSASCINSLGFAYINGVFQSAGFYDPHPTTGGGLWVSHNYGGVVYGPNDLQNESPQSATAKQLLRLFVLAGQRKLVDVNGTIDFLLISSKMYPYPPEAYSSWIYKKLVAEGKSITVGCAKVGSEGGYSSDVAYIQETSNGKTLKYVICVSRTTSSASLENVSVELANMIAAAHP